MCPFEAFWSLNPTYLLLAVHEPRCDDFGVYAHDGLVHADPLHSAAVGGAPLARQHQVQVGLALEGLLFRDEYKNQVNFELQ